MTMAVLEGQNSLKSTCSCFCFNFSYEKPSKERNSHQPVLLFIEWGHCLWLTGCLVIWFVQLTKSLNWNPWKRIQKSSLKAKLCLLFVALLATCLTPHQGDPHAQQGSQGHLTIWSSHRACLELGACRELAWNFRMRNQLRRHHMDCTRLVQDSTPSLLMHCMHWVLDLLMLILMFACVMLETVASMRLHTLMMHWRCWKILTLFKRTEVWSVEPQVEEPKHHLGGDFFHDKDRKLCCSAQTYVRSLVDRHRELFGEQPKEVHDSLDKDNEPELDNTPLLGPDGIKHFQTFLGDAQWLTTLSWFDIAHTIISLGHFCAFGMIEACNWVCAKAVTLCH